MSDRWTGKTIAVLGFGHQGAAQAQVLREGGSSVVVGARPEGEAAARARAAGFETLPIAAAAARAELVAVLLPDLVTPQLWPGILPALDPGAGIVFAHGYSLVYFDLEFPAASDVVLVSPAGPGHVLRSLATSGETLAGFLAVHRDGSGGAWSLAEEWARRLRLSPVHRTTAREETEIDLFGEQTVLCGGMNALVRAAFDTLVEAGYSPEIAYLECVHQLAALAGLLRDQGVTGLRGSISGTALYGDLTRGPRVIGEPSRRAMREILDEIRSGAFAAELAAEVAGGSPRLTAPPDPADPLEAARRRALARE